MAYHGIQLTIARQKAQDQGSPAPLLRAPEAAPGAQSTARQGGFSNQSIGGERANSMYPCAPAPSPGHLAVVLEVLLPPLQRPAAGVELLECALGSHRCDLPRRPRQQHRLAAAQDGAGDHERDQKGLHPRAPRLVPRTRPGGRRGRRQHGHDTMSFPGRRPALQIVAIVSLLCRRPGAASGALSRGAGEPWSRAFCRAIVSCIPWQAKKNALLLLSLF